jgi:hypothetical protein
MDNHPKPVLNYPERVKTVLFGIIFEMSKTPWLFAKKALSDFSRKRKLDFENLLRFLISMQSGTIAHELLKHFNYSLDTLSNSAFYQQRKKLLIFALQYLLRQFNSQFPLELYKGKYNLVASDGCEFNIARNPNDPSTFHPPNGKSTKGFNMLHTISFYDILSKRYLDCETQPGRLKNEFKAFCELVDRYPYEGAPIFIADRGFASYNVFAHVKEKGALFMIRAKDVNVRRLLALETLPNNLNEYVEIILSRTKSIKKWQRPDLAKQYRYIDSSTSFDYIKPGSNDEYHLSLRIVRFEVADGIFENIITNLPADEFSADEIKKLYNMRWNIETSFRDLKHTIGTSNFHSKKVEYIEQEIWARLILFNFCSIITTHVVIEQNDTKYVYQVNFAMAMKICHHFIRLHEYEAPPYVEALIGSYSLPIRLNRNFARQHRFRLPASFCYRFS